MKRKPCVPATPVCAEATAPSEKRERSISPRCVDEAKTLTERCVQTAPQKQRNHGFSANTHRNATQEASLCCWRCCCCCFPSQQAQMPQAVLGMTQKGQNLSIPAIFTSLGQCEAFCGLSQQFPFSFASARARQLPFSFGSGPDNGRRKGGRGSFRLLASYQHRCPNACGMLGTALCEERKNLASKLPELLAAGGVAW